MSAGRDVGSAQALSHELEDSSHLFARYVELLDDLVDAEFFEVLDDRRLTSSPPTPFVIGTPRTVM